MRLSEVFTDAADLLARENGWCSGSYGPFGASVGGPHSHDDGNALSGEPNCMVGAIRRAINRSNEPALRRCVLSRRALDAVVQVVGDEVVKKMPHQFSFGADGRIKCCTPEGVIIAWNDKLGTKERAVNILRTLAQTHDWAERHADQKIEHKDKTRELEPA